MSASQPGPFRTLLEQYTEPHNVLAPPGVPGEVLVVLAVNLGKMGYDLPGDYIAFLHEVDGMVWNGVQMFGTPGSCPLSRLDLLNAKSLLDPGNRIEPGKLLIGVCESFLYAYNPEISVYERYHRGAYSQDKDVYGDFSGLLTSVFAERQGTARVFRPVVGGTGAMVN